MQAVLTIKGLSKSFGRRKVIDNISFEVYAGEVFGFLGPNGAGKTTTIKMIMGFLSIDEGEVSICGIDLKKDYERAMANIGGIVENPEMYKDLSGLVNLRMYARLHDGVTEERIRECVAMVGMQNRINEKVKKYSLGMKQRVGLAQAILHRPRVLILDEPTNGLDPAGIRELRDILKRLAHEEQVAVFVSSHLLSEMELMCDRVAIIHNGRILGEKPIKELLAQVSGKVMHRFSVRPVERALEVLAPQYGQLIRGQSPDSVDLEIGEDKVPEVAALLAQSGISIFGVIRLEQSLEEAFLSITGGGNTIE